MTQPDMPAPKLASLHLECDLDAPIEKVWRALSEPALLAQWLLPNDIAPETGAHFTRAGAADQGGTIDCEILESDPPRHLRFSWRASETRADGTQDTLDTVVTFELEPTADGRTHLRLVHDGFVVASDYRFDLPAEEPEIVVLLPPAAIARRRIRKPRRATFARRSLPTLMRLAA
ncbi:ATPase [Kaistia algarum]|uniref:SRPBCC family protein n=1 Tax=Kaistia algarum TaxID=2083279 RepID=UPI000CE7CE6C|nr:SRPBCC domain-containing protein [Kaistia algarum]MCX5514331.1 SRPBCC domain-containing protein [Kaistia algarum]PPE79084.1 ATPase [Kaistia algarum]